MSFAHIVLHLILHSIVVACRYDQLHMRMARRTVKTEPTRDRWENDKCHHSVAEAKKDLQRPPFLQASFFYFSPLLLCLLTGSPLQTFWLSVLLLLRRSFFFFSFKFLSFKFYFSFSFKFSFSFCLSLSFTKFLCEPNLFARIARLFYDCLLCRHLRPRQDFLVYQELETIISCLFSFFLIVSVFPFFVPTTMCLFYTLNIQTFILKKDHWVPSVFWSLPIFDWKFYDFLCQLSDFQPRPWTGRQRRVSEHRFPPRTYGALQWFCLVILCFWDMWYWTRQKRSRRTMILASLYPFPQKAPLFSPAKDSTPKGSG